MNRYIADEGFRRQIREGVVAAVGVDIVTVQSIGLTSAADEVVLEWAATHNRVLWTHDRDTMIAAAWARVRRGERMAGVIFVEWALPDGPAIRELSLVAASRDGEFENQVVHLPFP